MDRFITVSYNVLGENGLKNKLCKKNLSFYRNQMPFLFVAMQIAMSFSYHPSEIMLGFFYFYE
jgi:hypothetical protein